MRSSPMPVSIEGLRQVDALVLRHLLELHEDEVPDLDETVAIGIGRAGRSARDMRPVIEEDFRAGPHGPVSPIAQKLSDVGMRMIRASGRPAIFFHRSNASSSSANTVTVSRSFGQPEFLGDQLPGPVDRVAP